MNGLIAIIGAGLLAVVLPAVGVAWWEHRKRAAETRARLARSEGVRQELQRTAPDGPARHAALGEAVPQAKARAGETVAHTAMAETKAAAATGASPAFAAPGPAPEALLSTAAAAATPPSAPLPFDRFDGPGWAETAPMTGMGTEPAFAETLPAELHFAETLPAELVLDDPAPRRGKSRQPS